jgi:hypothetical protein
MDQQIIIMKPTDKKPAMDTPSQRPVPKSEPKQTSGDKAFDDAIDRMLKPFSPQHPIPSK